MTYNVNEIREMLSFFNPEHFTDEDADFFICELGMQKCVSDFDWETGASKCVIIPHNRDYVIKIPFDGGINYDGEFFPFEYGGGEGWDYCDLENVYWVDLIQHSDFSQFFLLPELIDGNDNWPIYIQPKVEMFKKDNNHFSAESIDSVRTKSKKIDDTSLPDEWLAVCLENLDNDVNKLDELIVFINEHFYDLHRGNLGFYGNQAVIIDYAGFGDN